MLEQMQAGHQADGNPWTAQVGHIETAKTLRQVLPGDLQRPPPRYSLGHPFGDNPLRGANEEEGRNPAGRGSGGRP